MSVRDKKILIIFLGVLVLVAAFFFGYRPLNEKKVTLEAENTSLRDTYADLSMKAANADMYKKEIKVMNTKMEEIFTHFPSYLQTENEIMDVVALEKLESVSIPSITIADPVAVDLAQKEEGTAEGDGTQTSLPTTAYQLYDVNSSVSFESSYKGLKDLIRAISKDTSRKSVGTVSATFESETGLVHGSMVYDTYFVYGLDKDYEAPVVPSIPHGIDNIFGTVK